MTINIAQLRNYFFAFRQELSQFCDRYVRRRPLLPLLLLYCLMVIFLKHVGYFQKAKPASALHRVGLKGALTGVVADHPDTRANGCVYKIALESFEEFGTERNRRSLQGTLLLNVVRSTAPLASPGDRIRFTGKIQAPPAGRIPGVFNYESYLENHGIRAMVYTSVFSVDNLGPSGSFLWKRFGWNLKQRVLRSFRQNLSEDQSTVLSGLVMGERPRSRPEIKRIFVESGTMHVLVASGSNVAFVAGLWFVVVHLCFRVPRRLVLLTAAVPVWIYVAAVGGDAPILRAAVMTTVALVAYQLMREDSPYHVLAVAALAILLPSPRSLFDVGFQMSFATVFGLIHTLSALETRLQQARWWISWPLRLCAATLTAQVWLFPITANVFHQFFPVSLIANMAILPVAAVGFASGVLLAGADFLHQMFPALGPCFHWVCFMSAGYLNVLIRMASFFADHFGTSCWLPPFSALTLAGYYSLCLSMIHMKSSRLSQITFSIGIVLLAAGLFPHKKKSMPSEPVFIWIDTGKETSCLMEAPDGGRILVNPGRAEPSDTSERVLLPFFATQHIRSLEAVVLTHRNPQQLSGLGTLCRNLIVKKILIAGESEDALWREWISSQSAGRVPVEWVSPQQSVTVAGLRLTSLPDTAIGERALLVSYRKKSILLDGVVSLTTQDYLLNHDIMSLCAIQARFSPKIRWRPDFISRVRPSAIIETGPASAYRPSTPPWTLAPLLVPQKSGWERWEMK